MKQIIKIALLLILITYSGWAVAKNSNPIHTHTNTPMELKPVSSNLGISYAAVCFLGSGDCGAGSFDKSDNDMGIDTGKQCQNEGYIYTSSNCVLPSYLNNKCPYNSAYYSECKQDIPRACTEAGYTKESKCASEMKLKKSPRCPWDNSYGICCKETCPNNSSLSCTGIVAGDDTCGYDCKQCCDNNCPSGSFENRTGSGGCGGSAIQNGCKTKTCYYPYTNCPCYPSCSGNVSSCSYPLTYWSGYDGCGGSCSECICNYNSCVYSCSYVGTDYSYGYARGEFRVDMGLKDCYGYVTHGGEMTRFVTGNYTSCGYFGSSC